jgi:hypothetical protein
MAQHPKSRWTKTRLRPYTVRPDPTNTKRVITPVTGSGTALRACLNILRKWVKLRWATRLWWNRGQISEINMYLVDGGSHARSQVFDPDRGSSQGGVSESFRPDESSPASFEFWSPDRSGLIYVSESVTPGPLTQQRLADTINGCC